MKRMLQRSTHPLPHMHEVVPYAAEGATKCISDISKEKLYLYSATWKVSNKTRMCFSPWPPREQDTNQNQQILKNTKIQTQLTQTPLCILPGTTPSPSPPFSRTHCTTRSSALSHCSEDNWLLLSSIKKITDGRRKDVHKQSPSADSSQGNSTNLRDLERRSEKDAAQSSRMAPLNAGDDHRKEAPTAGCSPKDGEPGVKHDNRASKAGPRPPGPHPTDTTRGSRTDPGTAAGGKQESRLPLKSVVTRQVQDQANKSVHRSGCKDHNGVQKIAPRTTAETDDIDLIKVKLHYVKGITRNIIRNSQKGSKEQEWYTESVLTQVKKIRRCKCRFF
ncbi:hypothetical protein Anapl_06147 [Anas platyrhynchos]|uniref:Uncharacterized protein n=1 Tax=Anas platyrhynchos TaxID=8839 RepID=R0JJD7_ANAPL|nr:hypothetical protein Anapl_06147 [Anas platyrhynchos]